MPILFINAVILMSPVHSMQIYESASKRCHVIARMRGDKVADTGTAQASTACSHHRNRLHDRSPLQQKPDAGSYELPSLPSS
ncbi:MAG: hypothetical protein J2P53_11625 [Bradyrhizobiaceae bacterium]|nr:hypothetical protein [Bradyrhizobiaceae bacterium]